MKFAMGSLLVNAVAVAGTAFDGISLGAGVGFINTVAQTSSTTTLPAPNDLKMQNTGTEGKNHIISQLHSTYSYHLDSHYNLALNVFYDFSDTTISSITDKRPVTYDEARYRFKNHWGVAIEPGVYLGEKTLLYLKFAYLRAKLEQSQKESIGTSTKQISNSVYRDGFGYGLGMKYLCRNNIYVGIEAQHNQYSRFTHKVDSKIIGTGNASITPRQIYGLLSVGYHF